MLIDCYKAYGLNVVENILNEYNLGRDNHPINVICWSHPHKDHSKGLYDVIWKYSSPTTKIIIQFGIDGTFYQLKDLTKTEKQNLKRINELIPRYNYLAFTPTFLRQELYCRIDKRVDIMLDSGLINEVKGLIDMGIDMSHQCMQGIGYKETYDAILSNNYDNLSNLISDEQLGIKENTNYPNITRFKKLIKKKDITTKM